ESFIENSNQAVQKLMDGIYNDDVVTFFEGINDNRAALTALGKDACVPIDTDKLNKLSDEAIALGGAGKFSGAGGGDCGLAFMPTHVNQHVLFERWERQQIKPLNLTVYSNGAKNINE